MIIKRILAVALAFCLSFLLVSPVFALGDTITLTNSDYNTNAVENSKLDSPLKHDIKNAIISGNKTENVRRIMIVMEKGKKFTRKNFNEKVGLIRRITSYFGLSPKVSFDSSVGSLSLIEYDITDPQTLLDIANSPGVKYVTEEPVLYPQRMDAIQIINSDVANAMVIHGENLTGKGQAICIVDTGVDYTHPNLAGHVILGRDTASEDNDPMDENGHGTQIAGMAQVTAPEAKIVAVRACISSCGAMDMVQGVQWCIDNKETHNISVISMSISDLQNHPGSTPCPTWMDSFLENAINKGIFVVSASGNQGFTTGIGYPACSPFSAAVGASNDTDNLWINTNTYETLDVLAPGQSIISTKLGGGYQSSSGTSNAVPFVAGAAAILQQNFRLRGIEYNHSSVLELMKNTGIMIGSWPRVDVEAAISGIKCYESTDCGADFYGPAYCSSEGDSMKDFTVYTCNNPGTLASSCSSSTKQVISELCSIGCDTGICIKCASESDCSGGDIWTGDAYCNGNDIFQAKIDATCNNPGTAASSCTYSNSIQLKQSCIGSCSDGECEDVECVSDSDCGTNGWIGNQYCSSPTKVSKQYRTFTCTNPGTTSSQCTHADAEYVINSCSSACSGGLCTDIACYKNADCGINSWDGDAVCQSGDVWQFRTEYTCVNPGKTYSYCSSETTNKLRRDCEFGCESGVCLDNVQNQASPYVCSSDADCGANGFVGSPTCQLGNVQQTFRTYTCYNPATFLSYCSQSDTPQIKETCSGECVNGACIANTCNTASDCGTDGWIEQPYCAGKDIFQVYRTWSCTIPGTNSCSYSDTPQLKESCTFSCSAGICLNSNGTGSGTEDIEVRNFLLQNASGVIPGMPAKIMFSVRNNGANTLTNIEWKLRNGVAAEYGSISMISPGETKIIFRDVTFPSSGAYYSSIELDPDWKINELNEQNNKKEAVWTVA